MWHIQNSYNFLKKSFLTQKNKIIIEFSQDQVCKSGLPLTNNCEKTGLKFMFI